MGEKQNLAESIRQRLKNLAAQRKRPFDEILRYYAMERFLYRLGCSRFSDKFFLKGGLILRVWNPKEHRATLDIDLLSCTSNSIENLRSIISEVAHSICEEDAVIFDTQKLIMRKSQTTGAYDGISTMFSTTLFKAKIPVLIDIGFNDVVIPKPQKIQYPTLLGMSKPVLLGYTPETVIAEKLESIVKHAIVNTRMKDFYDLWTIFQIHEVEEKLLRNAIAKVFAHRNTPLKIPVAFTEEFYNSKRVQQLWKNFLATLGKEHILFNDIIKELSDRLLTVFESDH